jgi:hypothetical protein
MHLIQKIDRRRYRLSLAKECYSLKLDLLTNATVVDNAIRFVSQRSKGNKPHSSSSDEDENESNDPDYDEDEDQPEGEQEEQSGEIAAQITTMKSFRIDYEMTAIISRVYACCSYGLTEPKLTSLLDSNHV